MPSSASPSVLAELQAAGENLNTWGAPRLNTALSMLEAAGHGLTSHTLTASVTLTYTNYTATNGTDYVQKIAAASDGSYTLTVGGYERMYLIWNASSYDQTIACSGGGDSVTVYAGEVVPVYCDATNVTRGNGRYISGDLSVAGGATFTGAGAFGGAGSFGGQVTIPETPSADTSAASKKYVDDQVLTASAGNLPATSGNANRFVRVNSSASGYTLSKVRAPVDIAAVQTAAFTPEVGYAYPVDASGGAITLTALPSSPAQGDQFEIHDANRTWDATNTVTFPGADGINGRSESQIVTLTGARILFEYVSADYGWEMKVIEPKGAFAYSSPFVNTPSITYPADGATGIQDETPTLTASAFGTTNDSDTHASSDWQVSTSSDFSTILVQTTDDATNKTSWTIPSGNLLESNTYYARVRYTGTTYGDSEWSDVISFTTASAFLDEDALAIIDAMDTDPSAARKSLINSLVEGLKTDGIWSKLDRLWVMAAHTAQAGGLDWKNPSTSGNALTAVNSPTFTTDQGYTGDGSSSYLNTNYAPSVDGSNLSQDSASMGVWVRTAGNTLRYYIGVNDRAGDPEHELSIGVGASDNRAYSNNATAVNFSTSPAANQLLCVNRSGASATQLYTNGSSDGTSTASSISVPDVDAFLLALNFDGAASSRSSGQVSVAFFGGSLTSTEHANLYSRLNTYMTGL